MGSVYAIRCTFTQRVKFGWTRHDNAEGRLLACQTGSPTELELVGCRPGSRADELYIHQCLERWRLHGEWFAAHDEVLDMAVAIGGVVPRMDAGRQAYGTLGWAFDDKKKRRRVAS